MRIEQENVNNKEERSRGLRSYMGVCTVNEHKNYPSKAPRNQRREKFFQT